MGWFVTVGGRNFLYYIGLVKKVHLGFSIRAHGKIQMNFLTNPIASLGKIMTNLGSILKRRDVFLLTKVHIVKAVVFLVVIYRYENWSIKKAEHQRIGALNCGPGCWEIKPVHPKGNQP